MLENYICSVMFACTCIITVASIHGFIYGGTLENYIASYLLLIAYVLIPAIILSINEIIKIISQYIENKENRNV